MERTFSNEEIHKIVDENKSKAIDFLQKILQIPSVTGNEKEIGSYIKKWFEENLELPVKVYEKEPGRPNLVVDWTGNVDGKRFVFNGHMDVFPPIPRDPGIYGPWSGKIADGCLWGRGAADMKGGLAAMIMAVYYMKRLGYVPNGTVTLSCDSDEENGGASGVEYLLELGELNGDFGLCAEPTNSCVMIEGTGGLWSEITYTAETAHSSIPIDYPNAIQKAMKAAAAIDAFGKKLQKERYYEPFGVGPTCSVTMIEGGEATNMYPAHCTIKADRRLFPGETADMAEKEIRTVLDKLKEEDPSMEYEYKRGTTVPVYTIDPDDEVVQEGLRAYREISGKETTVAQRPGGTDAHKIRDKYGYSIIIFATTDGYNEMCMPNEKYRIDDYLLSIKVYMKMVMDLLG